MIAAVEFAPSACAPPEKYLKGQNASVIESTKMAWENGCSGFLQRQDVTIDWVTDVGVLLALFVTVRSLAALALKAKAQ